MDDCIFCWTLDLFLILGDLKHIWQIWLALHVLSRLSYNLQSMEWTQPFLPVYVLQISCIPDGDLNSSYGIGSHV